jgi:predicted DNA-binding protein YlxM (UPF0122 family)
MAMAKRNIDRNVQMFKDYLEIDSFVQLGEKYDLCRQSASNSVKKVWSSMLRMAKRDELPLPKSVIFSDVITEKEYWLDMVKTYELYLEEERRVEIDSPVRKLGINGSAQRILNELNIFTIGNLLVAMKEDAVALKDNLKHYQPNFRDYEKKLIALGLDPQGGRDQRITQQQGK